MKPITESCITLAHGDGGDVTLEFIREEILSRFGNPVLNKLEDGSKILIANKSIVISSDFYIVDPPIFPGGDIGRLAISGTVNDILSSGAIPRYLTLGLLIDVGFPLSQLRYILDSAQLAAQSVGIEIIAGDTKVLENRAKPGVYINTTGVGLPLWAERSFNVSDARIGDDVIVTGTIGNHGLAVLSAREGLGCFHIFAVLLIAMVLGPIPAASAAARVLGIRKSCEALARSRRG